MSGADPRLATREAPARQALVRLLAAHLARSALQHVVPPEEAARCWAMEDAARQELLGDEARAWDRILRALAPPSADAPPPPVAPASRRRSPVRYVWQAEILLWFFVATLGIPRGRLVDARLPLALAFDDAAERVVSAIAERTGWTAVREALAAVPRLGARLLPRLPLPVREIAASAGPLRLDDLAEAEGDLEEAWELLWARLLAAARLGIRSVRTDAEPTANYGERIWREIYLQIERRTREGELLTTERLAGWARVAGSRAAVAGIQGSRAPVGALAGKANLAPARASEDEADALPAATETPEEVRVLEDCYRRLLHLCLRPPGDAQRCADLLVAAGAPAAAIGRWTGLSPEAIHVRKHRLLADFRSEAGTAPPRGARLVDAWTDAFLAVAVRILDAEGGSGA